MKPPLEKNSNQCICNQDGTINKESCRKMCDNKGTTLMVSLEDLRIRTARRSAGGERRNLSTGGEQEGIGGNKAMNFIDISSTFCSCLCSYT